MEDTRDPEESRDGDIVSLAVAGDKDSACVLSFELSISTGTPSALANLTISVARVVIPRSTTIPIVHLLVLHCAPKKGRLFKPHN